MWSKILSVICALIVLVSTENASRNRRAGHSDLHISFSAGLTHNMTLHPSPNVTSRVPFNNVWLNVGNGYDKTTGIFTCPHKGTYVFFYYLLADSTGQMWVDLLLNGNYQNSGYAHKAGGYASAGNSIVLNLNETDQVYVGARGDCQLYGQPDDVYSTFSGFILLDSDSGQSNTNANIIG